MHASLGSGEGEKRLLCQGRLGQGVNKGWVKSERSGRVPQMNMRSRQRGIQSQSRWRQVGEKDVSRPIDVSVDEQERRAISVSRDRHQRQGNIRQLST
jgi:hypothetical protein